MTYSIRIVSLLISMASVALAADHFLFKSSHSGQVEATENVYLKGKLEVTGDARVRTLYSESFEDERKIDASVQVDFKGKLQLTGDASIKPAD